MKRCIKQGKSIQFSHLKSKALPVMVQILTKMLTLCPLIMDTSLFGPAHFLST